MSPKSHRPSNRGLLYGLASVLALAAFLIGSTAADAEEPTRVANAAMPQVGLEGEGLADEALSDVRGMGSESEAPDQPNKVGVILWDEGKGSGGSNRRNRAEGSGNYQTNRASFNGR